MKKYLWKIDIQKIKNTNLALYSNFIKKNYRVDVGYNFNKIWKWSIDNPEFFWKSIWDFTKVKGKVGKVLLKKSKVFYKNKFFPDSKLNYAQNILKKNNNDPAIIFKSENGYKTTLSWKNFNFNVSQISNWMKINGITKGDRVAAYLPNIPEAVMAYIATSALGAVWSSCSPDFGADGVIDRFSQINPKILFIGDKYFYNGNRINILERLNTILTKVPSIKKVVLVPYPGTKIEENKKTKNKIYEWGELIASKKKKKLNL